MAIGSTIFNEGYISSVPELAYGQTGKPRVTFSVRFSRRVQDGAGYEGGNYVSDFFNCVAFGDIALAISEHVQKGSPVIIHGSIQMDSWESKTGEKRQAPKIVVDTIGLSLRLKTRAQESSGNYAEQNTNGASMTTHNRAAPAPEPPSDYWEDGDEELF